MISLETALLILQLLSPDLVLAVWSVAYLASLAVSVGAVFSWQQPADPVVKPRHEPAHAAGHVEHVDQPDTATTGPRHSGIGATDWRPAHTAVQYRGRHHTGERRLVASLLNTQACEITVDDLAEAMAGVR